MSTHWFFIALATPILHAIANHIDKHLISNYFKEGNVGALTIFTSVFALLALPIIFLINSSVFDVSFFTIIFLILNGALVLGYVIFYLKALENDEASIVAPFFQLVPVFGFIIAYFILGEILARAQIYASLLIVGGAIVLSLDSSSGFKIKSKLLLFTFTSSFLYALNNVIFKFLAIDTGFTTSLFWILVGQVCMGIALYIFVKSYRKQFNLVIRDNPFNVLGLNLINGLIILAGDTVLFYALLFAPVTLVLAVSGLQPLFVFIFGILITVFLPQFGKESFEKKVLIQKIVGIFVIIIGSFYIS